MGVVKKIQQTELFRVMRGSERYDSPSDVIEIIAEMRVRVVRGEDAEKILHEEGFGPEYIPDIM